MHRRFPAVAPSGGAPAVSVRRSREISMNCSLLANSLSSYVAAIEQTDQQCASPQSYVLQPTPAPVKRINNDESGFDLPLYPIELAALKDLEIRCISRQHPRHSSRATSLVVAPSLLGGGDSEESRERRQSQTQTRSQTLSPDIDAPVDIDALRKVLVEEQRVRASPNSQPADLRASVATTSTKPISALPSGAALCCNRRQLQTPPMLQLP